ncbi:MAG: MFS transporter [Promethearchaeota archaeon]|nr:MAG: MFS transporter [Candidatus Lokiarchaeota archaeon]
MEKKPFKPLYTGVFSITYLIQGISQSLFTTVVPIYLVIQMGAVGGSDIGTLGTIVLLPFIVKFLYGMLSDKFSLGKFGRRKPWIIGSSFLAGIIWVLIPFIVSKDNALMLFTIGGLLIYLGMAIADTAVDGLILDNCPKEQLGRVQGICWAFRSVGIIAGGPLIVAIFIILEMPIEWVFFGYGIAVIATSFFIFLVKEILVIENVKILDNLKTVFGKRKNWTVFSFALFNAFVDGVIFLFVSLFILFQTNYLTFTGGVIDTGAIEESENLIIYGANAFIAFIIGIGVVIGAIIGGYIADFVSRKLAFYSSMIITTVSLLLFIIPSPWWVLLIFALLVGSTNGWRNSGFSAIVGQISAQYPEVDSTYYATCNSFANIGTVIGLLMTTLILGVLEGLEYFLIFSVLFVFMALISNLGIIPFLFMDPEEYELE